MAILTFPATPDGLLKFEPGAQFASLLSVEGALSAGPSLIEALTIVPLYRYGPPYYYENGAGQDVLVQLEGSFAYGALGTVRGTVTAVRFSVEGTEIASITEVDADAGETWIKMTGNGDPFAALMKGDDTITGTAGSDYLFGQDGNDVIMGMGGIDTLAGGDGDDQITGGSSNDSLYGGAGYDTIIGHDGDDYIYGGAHADRLFGNQGRDSLVGNAGHDVLNGANGGDYMDGGYGDDTLYGGRGHDRLSGGAGDDMLSGGFGNDRFVFRDFGRDGATGKDTITDFEVGDLIMLGRVGRREAVNIVQDGSDVLIELDSNSVTVLDAALAEVQAAVEISRYSYYYY